MIVALQRGIVHAVLATTLWGLPAVHASADTAAAGNRPDPLFASFETLELTLEAPLGELMVKRDGETEVAGKIRYPGEDGALVELDVQVRTRGKFRARKEVCDFVPLRLNFRTSQVAGTLFAKQDKLKLVTHCDSGSTRYSQTVVSEYLTYRILNLMTDFSYRARLLKIRYMYSAAGKKVDSYAFLIESDERLARRLGVDLVATPNLRIADLQPDYSSLVGVFEYLIGNTDFSPIAAAENEDCCHNHTPFSPDGEVFYSVPYDFDQCGLVDSPHAAPNPRFRLRSTRDRLYRGRCVHNAALAQTLETFRNQRSAIEALVAEQPELSKFTRRRIANYIASFYKIINDPRQVQKRLVKKCI